MQTSSSGSSNQASIARLQVKIEDVNDKFPVFQGMDENGIYPAAVSVNTQQGELVIYVTAIDLDRDSPYNKVEPLSNLEGNDSPISWRRRR